jgi:alpha-glucoside transport system substrate-binding protein
MNMRKKSVGLVAAAASSALVLAAGIAPSAQAADANTVTIWTSVDQPVLDGLKAGLAPIAKKQGITVKWEKVDNINQLIVTDAQGTLAGALNMHDLFKAKVV